MSPGSWEAVLRVRGQRKTREGLQPGLRPRAMSSDFTYEQRRREKAVRNLKAAGRLLSAGPCERPGRVPTGFSAFHSREPLGRRVSASPTSVAAEPLPAPVRPRCFSSSRLRAGAAARPVSASCGRAARAAGALLPGLRLGL